MFDTQNLIITLWLIENYLLLHFFCFQIFVYVLVICCKSWVCLSLIHSRHLKMKRELRFSILLLLNNIWSQIFLWLTYFSDKWIIQNFAVKSIITYFSLCSLSYFFPRHISYLSFDNDYPDLRFGLSNKTLTKV